MSLRWLWFDHIPPELNVPKEARKHIKHAAQAIARQRGTIARIRQEARTLLYLALVLIAVALVGFWLLTAEPFGLLASSVAFQSIYLFLIPSVSLWLAFRFGARNIHLACCQLGYLCCVKCGYVHTGLSKDVKECPECGAAREFGKCIHCNAPQDWPMQAEDCCTQCGRRRLS
jgi:hypothetical protein